MRRSLSLPGDQPASVSRRLFLRRAVAGAALSIVAPHVIGRGATPPSDKLNLGFVGVGGRGRDDLKELAGENVVGLCDVDESRAGEAMRTFPKAKYFREYRRMLDAIGGELDGVVVATPDHTHAVIAMAAIQLGKHVYCEKPLAHSVHDVRRLMDAAREKKVTTQLGNQGHSTDSIRQFIEMLRAGAIGTVREIHARCQNSYRPRDYRVRPTETPPVPATLDWDSWIGPAPYRPYHPTYLPGKWRGWVDFGTGIIGDWVCHVVDPVFWALDLGAPTSVQAQAVEYTDPRVRAETFPPGCSVTFEFPARAGRPAVRLTWYDGSLSPPRPPELEPTANIPGIGAIVVGDQGTIMYGSHGAAGAQLIPAARMREYQRPAPTLPRVSGHHSDWVEACKSGRPAGSNFDYGGPLTEIALLGVVALQLNGERLDWDSRGMRITNHPEANRYLHPPYRPGWKL